jgi:hypothetical protein
MIKNLDWIRNLVESERRMEETGLIDLRDLTEDSRDLEQRTHEYLRDLKEIFIEYATAFNNMKESTLSTVKIYGISNTVADFMLFRNGYKLLFSATAPGRIVIALHGHGAPHQLIPPGAAVPPSREEALDAQTGPFGELTWTCRGAPIRSENLVRHYLTRFIKESAK